MDTKKFDASLKISRNMTYRRPKSLDRVRVEPVPDIIELFNSLNDPDTHIYNTLETIFDFTGKYTFNIPIETEEEDENEQIRKLNLIFFKQLFLNYDFDDDLDEEIDEEEEEEEMIEAETKRKLTKLELYLGIIYNLICISITEHLDDYMNFFLQPDFIVKLFQYYDKVGKVPIIINLIAEKNDKFIEVYNEPIKELLNAPPFTAFKAELLNYALKVDEHIFSGEKLLNILDDALKSRRDVDLYYISLKILGLLVKMIPDEIIPNILPVMPNYITFEGDNNDDQKILELYINILDEKKTFNGVVGDAFINLLFKIINQKIQGDTIEYVSKILLFDYDLTPFLDYLDFFEALLSVFSNFQFSMQRSVVIFISRLMTLISASQVLNFAKPNFIKSLNNFMIVDDDELLTLSALSIVSVIVSNKLDFEWPIEVINGVEKCSFFSDEKIAQIAQTVLDQIVHE